MFYLVEDWLRIVLSVLLAFTASFFVTPYIKILAAKVGAIDVPDSKRHFHDHPIARLGGLAIYLGFIAAVLFFVEINTEIRGILLGSAVIVVLGVVDDIKRIGAWQKLLGQVVAAIIAVAHGTTIEVLRIPAMLYSEEAWMLGVLSVPLSIIWIVGITNSVNLIDGLDGLAVGVSTISSLSMLVVSLLVGEPTVAVLLAALVGACVGFLPYNFFPAKIFMGDTGALLLGYLLSTLSILGMFKLYAVFTFVVPILALAIPLFDTLFAIARRIHNKQSPMLADRGHLHHKLIDMGLSQKQAVAILYSISAVMGLISIITATYGAARLILFISTVLIAVATRIYIKKIIVINRKKAHKAVGVSKETNGEIPVEKEDIS